MTPFFDPQHIDHHDRPALLRRRAEEHRLARQSPTRTPPRRRRRGLFGTPDGQRRGMTSGLSLQITFDCADPHALARFWAAVLDLEVEDHHDFIGTMLDAGHANSADVVLVDGRRAWVEAASCADPQGRYPRMLFMAVPEGKSAKNRVHLDLHLTDGHTDPHIDAAREAEVVRIEALGATRLYDGQLGPQRWVTMADPEGNEFCVG